MPLPDFTQLQASPDLLLNWLKTNLLVADAILNVASPGLSDVTFIPHTAYPGGPLSNAVDDRDSRIDAYTVTNNPGQMPNGQATLRSYVCNYVARKKRHVDVGTRGDYCFTTNLNGCTFAIGPPDAQHVRRVSHANTPGDPAAQRLQTQNAHNTGADLAGLTLLEPSNYRHIGTRLSMQATAFGIRTGLQWAFYFQLFSAHTSGNYRFKMYDVFRIQART